MAVVLVLSVVSAGCGDSGVSAETPKATLEAATLRGIESGKLNLALELKAPGPDGGTMQAKLSGPFQGQGKGKLPEVAMTAEAHGEYKGKEIASEGGITVRPTSAYVKYEGAKYEVNSEYLALIESTLEQTQNGETGTAGGCQEELGNLEVTDLLEGGRDEGSAIVGGAHTTKFSGKLNVSGAIDSLLEALASQGCQGWVAAAGSLPSRSEIEAAESQVVSTANTPRVSVYIGRDNIVRRISATLMIEPDHSENRPKRIAIDFNLELTDINGEPEISALRNTKPLGVLLAKLHVNPIRLLRALQGEEHGERLGDLLVP